MSNLLDPAALRYFFGPQFNVDVAMAIMPNYKDAKNLERDLQESIEQNRPHVGIQLVGYQDIDTGFSTVAMMRHPGAMSGVSFFADSKHRLFGGNTLVCVPLTFCSSLYKPTGDHLVYRHTYKRPEFNAEELKTWPPMPRRNRSSRPSFSRNAEKVLNVNGFTVDGRPLEILTAGYVGRIVPLRAECTAVHAVDRPGKPALLRELACRGSLTRFPR